MTPEEYEAHDDCAGFLEEYWQPEDERHNMAWSHGNLWNPDDAPEQLIIEDDSYFEGNVSDEYYKYDTDSTDHFSHSTDYLYAYDS